MNVRIPETVAASLADQMPSFDQRQVLEPAATGVARLLSRDRRPA